MTESSIRQIIWISTDLDRTKRFYGELFEWRFLQEDAGYIALANGAVGGGFVRAEGARFGSPPTVFVEVDDIETVLNRAVMRGGRVLMTRVEAPGGGAAAVMNDPDGNRVGLVEPARTAFRLRDEALALVSRRESA